MARKRNNIIKARYFLEYAIFRLLEIVLYCVPPSWIDAFGCWLGSLCYHLLPNRRKIVERNFRIVLADLDSDQNRSSLVRETFCRTGANLLGGMRCMFMNDSELAKHFSLEGAELATKHLSNKKNGAIFALCHMGNWEILSRIAHLIAPGVPTGAFYRPLNNPFMNRIIKRRREKTNTILFSNKEGFIKSGPLLRKGGVLGILADQNAGSSGCLCAFFGRTASCSPLVELMQRRTQSAIFYVTVERDAPAHWHIRIRAHGDEVPTDTCHIMKGIEQSLKHSLADGFWMHNRWKLPKKMPLNLRCERIQIEPESVKKPWRWLFITSKDTAIADASKPAIAYAASVAKYTEVDIICDHPLKVNAVHIQQHLHNDNIVRQIESIDATKPYPLDIIVIFSSIDEWTGISFRQTKPKVIAIKGHFNSRHIMTLKAEKPLTDKETWWEFIKELGIPPL